MIFVVTPPGATASKIKPTFNSVEIGKTKANIKAIIGKRISDTENPFFQNKTLKVCGHERKLFVTNLNV